MFIRLHGIHQTDETGNEWQKKAEAAKNHLDNWPRQRDRLTSGFASRYDCVPSLIARHWCCRCGSLSTSGRALTSVCRAPAVFDPGLFQMDEFAVDAFGNHRAGPKRHQSVGTMQRC